MKPTKRAVTSYEITADMEVWYGLRQLLEKGVERECIRSLNLGPLRQLLTDDLTDDPKVRFQTGARLEPEFPATPAPGATTEKEKP
jgi:hypothetical protein